MPPTQNTDAQPQQHVIASPNPTIDDSRTTAPEPGTLPGTKVEPAAATTAAPMKKASKPKRRRKTTHKD